MCMRFLNSQTWEVNRYVYFLLTQAKQYLSIIWKQFIKYGTQAYLVKYRVFDIHKAFNSLKCL